MDAVLLVNHVEWIVVVDLHGVRQTVVDKC